MNPAVLSRATALATAKNLIDFILFLFSAGCPAVKKNIFSCLLSLLLCFWLIASCCMQDSRKAVAKTYIEFRVFVTILVCYHSLFINFTIQSIHVGLPVRTSIKTFAGCMSSK